MIEEIAEIDFADSLRNLKIREDNSCKKSNGSIEYDCSTGAIFDNDKKKLIGYCDCFYEEIRAANLKEFYSILPDKFDLKNHKILKTQMALAKHLETKVKPTKGAFVFGPSGQGKTHSMYKHVEDLIKVINGRVRLFAISSKQLENLWVEKYGDNGAEARRKIASIYEAEVVLIDNIDKIGTMTASKESELYELFNNLEEKRRLVYITSNISLDDFCSTMPTHKLKDYSVYNRIVSLCSVYTLGDTQLKI